MRILHISDLHFWTIVLNPRYLCNKRILGNLNLVLRRRHYVRQERTDSFLDALRSIQPDAVLVGGDLTTTAMPREYEMASAFMAHIAAICPALHVIPGNHDYYTFEACRHKWFHQYLGRHFAMLDATGVCQLDGDTSLLHIPTVRANIISSRGFISKAQLETTRATIEQAPGRQLIALGHYPYLNRTPDYQTRRSRRLSGASALRHVLGQSGRPTLYLAGHVHLFSHFQDPLYTNLTQVTSPALFYDRSEQAGGFTEIWMDKGALRIFPWIYKDGWTRGAASSPAPAG